MYVHFLTLPDAIFLIAIYLNILSSRSSAAILGCVKIEKHNMLALLSHTRSYFVPIYGRDNERQSKSPSCSLCRALSFWFGSYEKQTTKGIEAGREGRSVVVGLLRFCSVAF